MKVIFFDSKGISKAYGIGSYGEYLLPELVKNRNIDLTYVSIQYGNEGGVLVEDLAYKKITVTFGYSETSSPPERLPSSAAKISFHIVMMRLGITTGLVHLNTSADTELCRLAKKYGLKVVLTQHTALKNVYGMVSSGPNFSQTQQLLSLCDGIIFLNEMTREVAFREYGVNYAKTTLIYNGVPTVKKWSENAIINERAKNGFLQTDFIVLYVGRIEEYKGVYHLIDSFCKFSRIRNDVKLVIIGSGDYSRALRRAKQRIGQIHFTGFLNKKEIKRYYHIADVGVLPSYSEQSSFSVIEMLQHHLPLIVSDIDGFSTFSKQSEVLKATLVRKPKLKAIHMRNLKKCLETLYLRPEQRALMVSNCSTLRNSVFNSTTMARQTFNFYETILQSC